MSPPVARSDYEGWRASRLGRITDAIEELVIRDLLGPVQGLRILDVGCGDGTLAASLSLAGAHVIGLDSDREMLDAARARIAKGGLDVALVWGDANALPLADASFDAVVAVTVLCFIEDDARVVSEMARVLRPGGRLVLGELGKWSLWSAKRRLQGWLGSPTWSAVRFGTVRELEALLTGSGLRIEKSRGAVFYPPCGWCAQMLAPFDPWLGRRSTKGAAFLALGATKSVSDWRSAPKSLTS